MAWHSVLQHPFITYTFLLSSGLAVLLALSLVVLPAKGKWRSCIFGIPLAVPVLSYLLNYFILGKFCSTEHAYLGKMAGFPSFHLFCMINESVSRFIGPASAIWLVFSLSVCAWLWLRTNGLLKRLRKLKAENSRAWPILVELCRDIGKDTPALLFLTSERPILFTAGLLRKFIVLSSGTEALMDEVELRAALAHELAHIQRRGYLTGWLFLVLRNLTLFSPASFWAYACFRAEEEKACDTTAVGWTGLNVELASALVKMMKTGTPSFSYQAPTCLSFRTASDTARVRLLLGENSTKESGIFLPATIVMVLLAVAGLVFVC